MGYTGVLDGDVSPLYCDPSSTMDGLMLSLATSSVTLCTVLFTCTNMQKCGSNILDVVREEWLHPEFLLVLSWMSSALNLARTECLLEVLYLVWTAFVLW